MASVRPSSYGAAASDVGDAASACHSAGAASTLTLSTQILIALILGLASGVFFGELMAPIKAVGDAFILLLQMTVLPYLSISLIVGLGSLQPEGAARLALRAGAALLCLWALAFLTIFATSLAYPDWESASFFSTSLVASGGDFDFLSLFIPSNPFSSLANTVVPAVVVFSAALGVALIARTEKTGLMNGLQTLNEALSAITTFVVRLAPIGIFAIAAYASGTLPIDQARSLQVYMAVYALSALVLALWTLPGLIACLTPYSWSDVMRTMRGALVTAFATGSLFVVLSVLVERAKQLVREKNDDPVSGEHFVDVIVPVAFTFPSTGKLLSLGFVLFAGWVAGYELSFAQYPALLVGGLSSYFGATVAAIPFLLDLFQIPSDTFQLFLVADNVVGTRFGAMLGAMHLIALAFIATAAMSGQLRVRPIALARYLAITVVLTLGVVLGVRWGFEAIGREYEGYDRFVSMQARFEHDVAKQFEQLPELPGPEVIEPDGVSRILERGTLRVGYLRDRLPWVFRNSAGTLVGFDVEMAQVLAHELGVSLEFYAIERDQVSPALDTGAIDVVMAGVLLTTEMLTEVSFSQPYVDETIAFIVRDYDRDDFGSRVAVRSLRSPKIAVPNARYYIEKLSRYLPQAEVTVVASPREFFRAEPGTFDALLYTAESGSAYSLVYPAFTVAVPRPDILRVPLAYAVRRGDEHMVELLSAWIELKQRDGTIDALFDHWIRGVAGEDEAPRWSVWRDVLGFGKESPPEQAAP